MFRFDESDPQLLIVYTGPVHPEMSDYYALMQRWELRLGYGERFGVAMVYEPHEHHAEDHSAEEEEAYTRLLNDVRRTYRTQINESCLGYASVLPADPTKSPEELAKNLEHSSENTKRFASYTFGIPGRAFYDLETAKTWLATLSNLPPMSLTAEPIDENKDSSKQIGLFYGSTTGITEYVAEEIATVWQSTGQAPIQAQNIAGFSDLSSLLSYDYLILGISTWNIGQLQDDWEQHFDSLDTMDFSGKSIALFGIGDQDSYTDTFLDAVGILGVKFRERGASIVGTWPLDSYRFEASLAQEGDILLGLGIDEINQPDLTSIRIKHWVAQLLNEWSLQPHAVLSA